jgi:hypothetical protein
MQLPREHHHQPNFILKRWTTRGGPLCEIRLITTGGQRKIVSNPRYPGGTGKMRDLYRVDNIDQANSQHVELNFMSLLDNDAAVSLDKFLAGQALTDQERPAWARFVLSMLYRHPEGGVIKNHMIDMWAEGTVALEADWAANRGVLDRLTFAEETAVRHCPAQRTSAQPTC